MNTKPVLAPAVAVAVTVAVTYVACLLASWLAPEQTIRFFSTWMHAVDLESIRRPPNKPLAGLDLAVGFASATIAGFLAGALFGWVQSKVRGPS